MNSDQPQFGYLDHILISKSKDPEVFKKSNRKMPSKPWRRFISSLYSNVKGSPITKYLKTEPNEAQITRDRSTPRKILAMKRENIRLQTHQRNKKNQQTFYKKHRELKTLSHDIKQGVSINYSLSSSKIKPVSPHNDQSKKKLKETSPFMLRKRSLKIEKEMRIIKHSYQSSLKKINSQDLLKTSLYFQNQKSLINGMKGSKMYYQFVREWQFPKHEDS